jgi:hypothetical protein
MKEKNRNKMFHILKGMAAVVTLTAGVFVITSFDDSGSASGSGDTSAMFLKTDPPSDCSSSVIVYSNNYSSGSGSGSISGSGSPSGGSGSISGSGSSTTIQTGPIGTLYTPMSQVTCSFTWDMFATCLSVACHPTGPATFKAFK